MPTHVEKTKKSVHPLKAIFNRMRDALEELEESTNEFIEDGKPVTARAARASAQILATGGKEYRAAIQAEVNAAKAERSAEKAAKKKKAPAAKAAPKSVGKAAPKPAAKAPAKSAGGPSRPKKK